MDTDRELAAQLGLLKEFVDIEDDGSEAAFLRSFPQLRSIRAVTWLVQRAEASKVAGALQASELDRAKARVLLDTDTPSVEGLVVELAALADAIANGNAGLTSAAGLQDALKVLMNEPAIEHIHPAMFSEILLKASVAAANLADHLETDVWTRTAATLALDAMKYTPPDAATRAERSAWVATQGARLYGVTNSRADLDWALRVSDVALLENVTARSVTLGQAVTRAALLREKCRLPDRTDQDLAAAIDICRGILEHPQVENELSVTTTNDLISFLGIRYRQSGVIGLLHEALAEGRRLVRQEHSDELLEAFSCHNHSVSLRLHYMASGDIRSAIDSAHYASRSVALTPAESSELPDRLGQLAVCLASAAPSATDVATALSHAREAVKLTSGHHPNQSEDPNQLNTLAALLTMQSARMGGDRASLDEAISALRAVVRLPHADQLPTSDVSCNLAEALLGRYHLSDSAGNLDEGWDLLKNAKPVTVSGSLRVASVQAEYALAKGMPSEALLLLEDGLRLMDAEATRLATSLPELRDIAGLTEGFTALVAYLRAKAGDLDGAVRAVERPRLCLPAPSTTGATARTKATVWIATSSVGTVVLAARSDGVVAASFFGYNTAELLQSCTEWLDCARAQMMSLQPFDSLQKAASTMACAFPESPTLLVVPVGAAALLPWNAATVDGGLLVERCEITLAPSTRWAAAAAERSRPTGRAVGFFDPGAGGRKLELSGDMSEFIEATDGIVLREPAGSDVLDAMTRDTPIAHFSCHAWYNALDPLGSRLEVGNGLSLRDIQTVAEAPWLVNLSACETAVPDLARLEQGLSFSVTFIGAGASHVVATLWPVPNDAAISFNRGFYRLLESGLSPASAFTQAVRQLRSSPLRPYYIRDPAVWGAFVYYGHPSHSRP